MTEGEENVMGKPCWPTVAAAIWKLLQDLKSSKEKTWPEEPRLLLLTNLLTNRFQLLHKLSLRYRNEIKFINCLKLVI